MVRYSLVRGTRYRPPTQHSTFPIAWVSMTVWHILLSCDYWVWFGWCSVQRFAVLFCPLFVALLHVCVCVCVLILHTFRSSPLSSGSQPGSYCFLSLPLFPYHFHFSFPHNSVGWLVCCALLPLTASRSSSRRWIQIATSRSICPPTDSHPFIRQTHRLGCKMKHWFTLHSQLLWQTAVYRLTVIQPTETGRVGKREGCGGFRSNALEYATLPVCGYRGAGMAHPGGMGCCGFSIQSHRTHTHKYTHTILHSHLQPKQQRN